MQVEQIYNHALLCRMTGIDNLGTSGENKKKQRSKKVKNRSFKSPHESDKICELYNKNFACESRHKIRWAVNIYDQWWIARRLEVMVDSQIRQCDLSFVGDFTK